MLVMLLGEGALRASFTQSGRQRVRVRVRVRQEAGYCHTDRGMPDALTHVGMRNAAVWRLVRAVSPSTLHVGAPTCACRMGTDPAHSTQGYIPSPNFFSLMPGMIMPLEMPEIVPLPEMAIDLSLNMVIE